MPPSPSRTTSYMANPGAPPADDDPLLAFAPVPHKQNKNNCIGPERQMKFIAALAASGIVAEAARSIGASCEAMYQLRNKAGGEEFRAAWDEALDRAISRVEANALQRAIEGEERMVVSGGKVLGVETRHNENLVTFLLRHRLPHRYGGQMKELKPGHPLYEQIKAEVIEAIEAAKPSDEEVFASIDEFLEGMRQRRLANEAILLEMGMTDDDAADGAAQDGVDGAEDGPAGG